MKNSNVVLFIMVLITSVLVAQAAENPSGLDLGESASKPSDLILGKWQDIAERDDAVIEFMNGGTGAITETTSSGTNRANISWKINKSFGNACILTVEYLAPKPHGLKPMTWLIAFEGDDTYLMQPVQNKVVTMKRKR